MANRFCERPPCGAKMSPWWPRTRMPNGELWCPGCVTNHSRNLATGSSAHVARTDWDEYRWAQDAQQRRYERSGVGGGKEEHDHYFGLGEHGGAGTEHLLTPKDWMRWSRTPQFEDLPHHEQEWHRGYEMGARHGADPDHADFTEMDGAASASAHPDHFSEGYTHGLHHALARSASTHDERTTLVPNQNSRVAVRIGQGGISGNASPEQRLAHFLAWDQPNIVRVAHDSGDSQTIFHCPFCGSGQVIARSDGTTECEFCHSAFTVQVQPQFAAFPQTIDGVPVDVPGMPSNTELPPGADPDAAIPPEEGGALPGTDGPPGADEEAEEESEEDDDKPAFLKGSYRTATGSVLRGDSYLRHLAIAYGPDREVTLARIRRDAG